MRVCEMCDRANVDYAVLLCLALIYRVILLFASCDLFFPHTYHIGQYSTSASTSARCFFACVHACGKDWHFVVSRMAGSGSKKKE